MRLVVACCVLIVVVVRCLVVVGWCALCVVCCVIVAVCCVVLSFVCLLVCVDYRVVGCMMFGVVCCAFVWFVVGCGLLSIAVNNDNMSLVVFDVVLVLFGVLFLD